MTNPIIDQLRIDIAKTVQQAYEQGFDACADLVTRGLSFGIPIALIMQNLAKIQRDRQPVIEQMVEQTIKEHQ